MPRALIRTILLASSFCASALATASAATVTLGTSVVPQADASATFDVLASGSQSNDYVEDGLSISQGQARSTVVFGFDAFGQGVTSGIYYSGRDNHTEIAAVDGAKFDALEVLVGDGFTGFRTPRSPGSFATKIAFEIVRDGVTIDSGLFETTVGVIFGVVDAEGFDLVRLSVGPSVSRIGTSNSATALDDLNVSFLGAAANPVPLPAAAWMFAAGLGGIWRRRSGR